MNRELLERAIEALQFIPPVAPGRTYSIARVLMKEIRLELDRPEHLTVWEDTINDELVIPDDVRQKLMKKLRKCSSIIDQMGHTPSRSSIEEQIQQLVVRIKL